MNAKRSSRPNSPSRFHKKWGPTLIDAYEQLHEQSELLRSYAEDIERIKAYPAADHALSAALEAQAKALAQRGEAVDELKRAVAGWALRLGKDRPQLVTRNFVELRNDPLRVLAAGQELMALADSGEAYVESLQTELGTGVATLEAALQAVGETKQAVREAQDERRAIARVIETLRHPVRTILIDLLGRSAAPVRALAHASRSTDTPASESAVSLVEGDSPPESSPVGGDEQAA